jgi:hypothetical protein
LALQSTHVGSPSATTKQIASINSDFQDSPPARRKKSEVVLPLPLLFGKPSSISLLRRFHKYLRHVELWGLTFKTKQQKQDNTREKLKAFSWRNYFLVLLGWILLPLSFFYFLFRRNITLRTKTFLFFFALLEVCKLETIADDTGVLLGFATIHRN